MDRLFRIDFYPQDWIIDTARLTPEERGVYIQIIALIYSNRGPIENDPVWIAGVSGCSSRMVKSVISKLEEKGFVQFSGGKITQKRAENELNIKRKHLELSSKGGRNRHENNRESKENKDLALSEDEVLLSSSSPYPYPYPYQTQLEEKEPKGSKKKSEIPEIPEIPEKPDDVSEQVWRDFILHRKTKEASITETVIASFRQEALKVGWTLEQAMIESCVRNWQGFKAEWVKNNQTKGNKNGKSTDRKQIVGQQTNDLLERIRSGESCQNARNYNSGPEIVR